MNELQMYIVGQDTVHLLQILEKCILLDQVKQDN